MNVKTAQLTMVPRFLTLIAIACAVCVWPSVAKAQSTDLERARAHLDAARALIPEQPLLAKATKWAELAEFEVKADRPEKAREVGFFLSGILQEEPDRPDDYIHLIAQTMLAQDKTQEAVNALGRVSKPSARTSSLYLEAAHQMTRRFGLQRGILLAREAFPDAMDRRSVYTKLCYTLTKNGQTKTAKEFIDITFDLFEIFIKIDAYRYAAVGLHTAGDTPGAIAILDSMLDQVANYQIATTRAQMYCELAATYNEIGQANRAKAMMQRAAESLSQVEPDKYTLQGLRQDVAVSWAQLGHRDQALQLINVIENKSMQRDVYEAVIQHDIAIGQVDRAKALNDQHRVFMLTEFNTDVAMWALKRGEANAALQSFIAFTEDFATDKWHREVARNFAKQGQHIAIQALLAKIEKADDRYAFHVGAAEGYLKK
ncbi:MAG: hypothetical protein AB8C95_00395 [Phycisphaeraceae bacterium]